MTMPLNYRVLKKANFKHFLTEYSRQLCNPNVRLCPSVSIKSGLGMSDDFVLWYYSAHNSKRPPQRTGLRLGSELFGCLYTVDTNILLQTSLEILLTSLNKISFQNLRETFSDDKITWANYGCRCYRSKLYSA